MKGDFSRDSFDPHRGYRRILHQQGRMVLDADLNEQAASQLHLLRVMALDLIGRHGGPADDAGFEIMLSESGQILIGQGRYYVDGVLVENDQIAAYDAQPFYRVGDADALSVAKLSEGRNAVLIHLDVFERTVNAIEDPSLADPALAGAGTSLRLQTVWHVRSIDTGLPMADVGEAEAAALLDHMSAATGALAVRAAPADPSIALPPAPGYTGAQNGLFRIEVHRSGVAGDAQYKWSRENGRIVGSWEGLDSEHLILAMDDAPRPPQVIELNDGSREAAGLTGEMVEIAAVDGDRYRIVSGDIFAVRALWGSGLHRPFARRWERIASRTDAGIALIEGGGPEETSWISLGDGLEIAFKDGNYSCGDYWQLPVRLSAELMWPNQRDVEGRWQPKFCSPVGIKRWRAPLALLVHNDERVAVRDLRHLFSRRT